MFNIYFMKRIILLCIAYIGFALGGADKYWIDSTSTFWYSNDKTTFSITTATQLAGLAKLVDNGNTFQGKTITLDADIFMGTGDRLWNVPIGSENHPFKGVFDGKNHKISGLRVAAWVTNSSGVMNYEGKDYMGLFGYTVDAKICNLVLSRERSYFSAKNYAGSLVGYAKGGIITNIHSEIDVKGEGTVGGIAGYADNISSSYHIGNVQGKGSVGGVVGICDTVKDVHSEGVIEGKQNRVGGIAGYAKSIALSSHIGKVSGPNYIGGIVGRLYGTIVDSYSEGDVAGDSNYVGGIAGDGNAGVIKNSYHINGDVTGLNYVGGVVGYIVAAAGTARLGNVEFSYHKDGTVRGVKYVGGLVGLSYVRCRYNSEVELQIKNSFAIGNVIGEKYVGGLVGLDSNYGDFVQGISSPLSECSQSISNSYSQGSISGDNNVGGILGGFFGEIDDSIKILRKDGEIKRQTAELNISSVYHEGGDVGGNMYVGGVLGSRYNSTTVIENSYSEGPISGTMYVGGIAGSVDTIKSSYHVGGSVKGTSYVGGLAGTGNSVTNSFAEGNVFGKDFVGGMVGTGTRIIDSYCEGFVSGTENYVGGLAGSIGYARNVNHVNGGIIGKNYVGGIAGRADSLVEVFHTKGNVIGIDSCIGGLSGHVRKVRDSYAQVSSVKGNKNVGGVAGYAVDSVNNTFFEGDSIEGDSRVGGLVGYAKNSIDNSYSIANIFGNENIGGLVGYQYSGTISKSMAQGNVLGQMNLGGLVGKFDGMKISQSYAKGNVSGKNFIGGIAGYAKGLFEELFAAGGVEGDGSNEPFYIGCVVGFANDSLIIKKTYFDTERCVSDIGGNDIAIIEGFPTKTTIEMQTQSTFDEWDFISTWKYVVDEYPFLQMYANSLKNAVVTTASLKNIKYDGMQKKPEVISVELFGDTLAYGKDYTIAYNNNTNVGYATISICGIAPYGGCKSIEFEIVGNEIIPRIEVEDTMTFTGVWLFPKVLVYNGDSLLPDSSYTTRFLNNLYSGIATISVTMKDNYSGSASQSFVIEKANPIISEKVSSTDKQLEILYGLGRIAYVNLRARDIFWGEPLDASEFSIYGDKNIGKFAWVKPDTIPSPGTSDYEVLFIPSDTVNYKTAKLFLPVKARERATIVVYDGSEIIDSAFVEKGTSYLLPYNLQKDTTINNVKYVYRYWVHDTIGYDFVGFYNGNEIAGQPGDRITINEDMKIHATYKPQNFTVTWLENENVILYIDTVAYGTMPEFLGEPPKKGWQWAKHTYTFKGWTPEIKPVTGDIAYTAVFDSTVRIFAVTFINGESKLQEDSLSYGEIPKYKGDTPTKKSTDLYSYEFIGWSPKIGPVEKDMEFFAVFDSTAKTGIADVRFVNLEKSVVAASRSIQISAAPVGASYAIFDMQGRVLKQGRVDSANFNIAMPIAGNYLVKVGNRTQRVSIK